MPLLRRHVTPFLPQLHAPFRRHLAEPVEGFAYLALPLLRQRFELSPALPHELALLRRHGTPLRETLLSAGPLLRRHGYPAFTSSRERLLPFGRQAIPLAVIALQQLLLLRGERSPSARRSRRRSFGGRRRRSWRRRHRGLREAGRGA